MVERRADKISLAIASGHNIQPGIQVFLSQAGFDITFKENGQLHACVKRDPYIGSITINRGSDIPDRLQERVCDFGILGRERVREAQLGGLALTEVVALGFSACKVSLEVPRRSYYQHPIDLDGLRIATSLPNIAKDYFAKHGAEVKIVKYTGKEEGAPAAGAADAVVAIWSHGTTARENRLKRLRGYETIPLDGHDQSEAVLAASTRYLEEHGRELIVSQFIERCRQAVGNTAVAVDLGAIRNTVPVMFPVAG